MRWEPDWVRYVLDVVAVACVEAVSETRGNYSDWVQKEIPLWYRPGAADRNNAAKNLVQP